MAFVADSYVFIKSLSFFVFWGLILGVYVFYADVNKEEVNADVIKGFVIMITLTDIFFDNFSIYNLVEENTSDIKWLIYVNKVSPLLYYTAKVITDSIIHLLGYSFIIIISFYSIFEYLNKDK